MTISAVDIFTNLKLLFRHIESILDPIQNTYQSDLLLSLEMDWLNVHFGWNAVRYVSNSSWSRTITNESIIIFILSNCYYFFLFFMFLIIEYYLRLSNSFSDFFNTFLHFTFFPRFVKLVFSIYWRVFYLIQKQCCTYINEPAV